MPPFYKDDRHLLPKTRGQGHPGLWFERFYDRYTSDWMIDKEAKGKFLQSLLGHGENAHQCQVGKAAELQRHAHTLATIAQHQGGCAIQRQSAWHFVTGLGNPHPVENGLSWHPVLGVPYLPGSAVKGMTRAWLELNDYDPQTRKRLFGSDNKDPATAGAYHGEPSLSGGEVIFFDALPMQPVTLMIDTMTSHGGQWYESGAKQPGEAANTPADWHSLNLVIFLAASDMVVSFAVAPRLRPNMTTAEAEEAKALAQLASQALSDALEHLGAGAKTAAGYGTFVALSEENQRHADKRQQALEQEVSELKKAAALVQMSPEQRQLAALKEGMELPPNQSAGSGAEFHRYLLETLTSSVDWPPAEQKALVEAVVQFLKTHRLKNKEKEARRIVREVLKQTR